MNDLDVVVDVIVVDVVASLTDGISLDDDDDEDDEDDPNGGDEQNFVMNRGTAGSAIAVADAAIRSIGRLPATFAFELAFVAV
jgi:hypothetical protein